MEGPVWRGSSNNTLPSQETPADTSAAAPAGIAVSTTVAGIVTSSCSSPLQPSSKRTLLTGGAASKDNNSNRGAPISTEALRRFFGLKGSSVSCKTQNGGHIMAEGLHSSGPSAPSDSNNAPRIFPVSSTAAASTASAAAADAAPKAARLIVNTPQPGPETAPLGPGSNAGGACWRLKRYLRPCSSVNLCSKQRCTGSGTSESPASPHAAGIAVAACENSRSLSTADSGRMGLKGTPAGATPQQKCSRAPTAAPETTSIAAAGRACRAPNAPEVLGRGADGRKNAHSVRLDAAAAAAAPSASSSRSAAAVRHTRPWVDLPEQLMLQVLDFGGREIGMTAACNTSVGGAFEHSGKVLQLWPAVSLAAIIVAACRRFAGLVRRQRRVLRFSGDASTTSSAEALIRAIMNSPSLRLLEITAGGSLSASQMDRLSKARSNALPQKLQVLVMRRCNRITDKSLRTLLLRLRDLRCVDLRDSFSLTDEALLTLGLLPQLERVALGLTAGARGCCRLTCRALKALLTPQREEQQQQQRQQQLQCHQQQEHAQQHQRPPEHPEDGCISPIKFLSLARCSEMKDFTVLANAKATLEFLDLRGTAIDDSSAQVFAELHNLQVLVLADTAVTTTTVSAVVDGCPKLQMLDISCTGPVSRECLFRLAFSLQSISRLKLSHTAAIDDVLLAHLLAELPLLRFLDVSHCWRVTSAFCDSHLTVASGKQLKRLGLFGCNVERQKVEAALILAGATNARLSLHNEMALFEMPRVYSTMKDLDI